MFPNTSSCFDLHEFCDQLANLLMELEIIDKLRSYVAISLRVGRHW